MDDTEYITLKVAAEELHCNIETLRRAARQHKLEVRHPGREIITTRPWMRAWMDQKTVGVGGENEVK